MTKTGVPPHVGVQLAAIKHINAIVSETQSGVRAGRLRHFNTKV